MANWKYDVVVTVYRYEPHIKDNQVCVWESEVLATRDELDDAIEFADQQLLNKTDDA